MKHYEQLVKIGTKNLSWRRSKEDHVAEPPKPRRRAGPWGQRLAMVGRTLDDSHVDLREVAVMTAGVDTFVNALTCQLSRYHGTWTAVTLQIDSGKILQVGTELDRFALREVVMTEPGTRLTWQERLLSAGQTLDALSPPPIDVSILEVPGGMIANVSGTSADGRRSLITVEIPGAWSGGK